MLNIPNCISLTFPVFKKKAKASKSIKVSHLQINLQEKGSPQIGLQALHNAYDMNEMCFKNLSEGLKIIVFDD